MAAARPQEAEPPEPDRERYRTDKAYREMFQKRAMEYLEAHPEIGQEATAQLHRDYAEWRKTHKVVGIDDYRHRVKRSRRQPFPALRS